MSTRFRWGWVPLREAFVMVALHHRHHAPPVGGIVALGLWEDPNLVGVAIIGRPTSRVMQAQGYAEITRLCVIADLAGIDGHANNAASILLSRARRAAQALGFQRIVTYTLAHEDDASLRGDGWQADLDLTGGGEWTTPSRPRAAASFPTVPKRRWRRELNDAGMFIGTLDQQIAAVKAAKRAVAG